MIKLYLYAAINTNTDLDGMILWALLHANVEPAMFCSRCHTNTQNGDISSPLFCGCFIMGLKPKTHWILNKIAINLHFLKNIHVCALFLWYINCNFSQISSNGQKQNANFQFWWYTSTKSNSIYWIALESKNSRLKIKSLKIEMYGHVQRTVVQTGDIIII